jgi:calcineurin-like phosphoesterase family protein
MASSPEQDEDRIRSKMVGWYDPRQLALTAFQTVLSGLFADRADYRLIEALQKPPEPGDYRSKEELWIDYVSDLGDGFNSTYSIARVLADESLPAGKDDELPRGSVLIMGGDEVYPTPSHAAYQERLVRPYAAALDASGTTDLLELYAIPGNHDWYDGLGSFMNLFCHGNRIGAWQTPQKRSYFALQLPHGFWLLGVDIQLQSDVDNPQIDYFLSLNIKEGDRVILCTAEPDWIYGNIYEGKKNLSVLETRLQEEKKAVIVLQLAGDLHHYRRHTLVQKDGTRGDIHLVTAGGGGAFLHPTHTHDVDTIKVGQPGKLATYALDKKTEYPSRAKSRWMGVWNVGFVFKNPWFGIATGAVYTILSWVMPTSKLGDGPLYLAFPRMLWSGIESVASTAGAPSGLVWVVGILLAFVAFTDTHKPVYRWIAGLFHGSIHLAAALGISATTTFLLGREEMNPVLERLVGSLMTFVGGYFVGATIMGIYLVISVVVFRRHGNEAFSSLKIEGFKNFLRMRVNTDGLSVWAFGLKNVPGNGDWVWKKGKDGKGRYEPSPDAPELMPRVIDHFVIPTKKAAAEAPKKPARKKAPVEEVA